MPRPRDAYGELSWNHGDPPSIGFYAQVRLPGDDQDHPWGQWSAFIEPLPKSNAFLTFVSNEAPSKDLRRTTTLELFNGKSHLGSILLLAVKSDFDSKGRPSDRIWAEQLEKKPHD